MSIGKGFWFALGGGVLGCGVSLVCGIAWLATIFWARPVVHALGRLCLLGLLVGAICLAFVVWLGWRGIDRGRG